MNSWRVYLKHGKEYLTKHWPHKAIECFKLALEVCPVDDSKQLDKILFYLGIALKKVGLPNGAAKCWIVARKVNKKSYSSKMLERFVNNYGMFRQENELLDDWEAFYSIQLMKYLRAKPLCRLENGAENDMIYDLICDHWEQLKQSGKLYNKNPEEKKEIFQSVKIIFPIYIDYGESPEQYIPVDFMNKKVISASDRCACGSGLSYSMCCGRTPGSDEIHIGIF